MNNPSPRFSKGDVVQLRDTGEMGRVVDDPTRDAGEWWYRIQFSMRTVNREEEDLVPLASLDETLKHLVETGNWGRMHSLRCALAVERLEHQNRSTVYSYRSQRIEFQAYQYKPLLKMLDSFDRKLLIADEVGLGKTIEAGIILTEMAARLPLSRILVVCPATLRDKWREELNRKFNQDFQIFTKKSLEQFIFHDRDNPRRRPLYGIVSTQSIRNPSF